MEPRRLLNVSNRLPITVQLDGDRLELGPSCGGVVVGLRGRHDPRNDLWFGWPGIAAEAAAHRQIDIDRECAALGLVPVSLSSHEVSGHYEGFSNGVIWPLFHYSLDRIPLEHNEWNTYRDVNERFAEVVAREYHDGDLIWIHDYHLMLLPAILRRKLPRARIGFFLHIPFPAYEVLRTLPWRLQILSGLMGADLIGFHTPSYVHCFKDTLRRELGMLLVDHTIRVGGRHVRIGAFPMGPDVERFRALARSPVTRAEAASIRAEAGGRTIFLGVDRLDYTKGIPRRLLAFERLLADEPSLRDRVRLIQVTVPSRTGIAPYQDSRHQIEEIVGRLNGEVGTIASAPVHYLYRSLGAAELAALYAACDVMLVTPLRDGMNLVAKEFVVCRPDEDGVLVLSELAGAAEELKDALIVNPYDVEALTAAMRQALALGRNARRARMRALRRQVIGHGACEWADAFLSALAAGPRPASPRIAWITERDRLAPIVRRMELASRLALVLDYDGTLVPFAPHPDQAAPDVELLDLLRTLSTRTGCIVHLVSGRTRENMDAWFGDLPLSLWGEHGLWRRTASDTAWTRLPEIPLDWIDRVRPLLDEFTRMTPGSFVEEKSASLAWHYRMAARPAGDAQAARLREQLSSALEGWPADVLEGHSVLEVRPKAVHKGIPIRHVVASVASDVLIVAIGDDRTDDDMFRALPPGGVPIHVGAASTAAQFRISDPVAVRSLLNVIVRLRAGDAHQHARLAVDRGFQVS